MEDTIARDTTVRDVFSGAGFKCYFYSIMKNSCGLKMKSWLKSIEYPADTQDAALTPALSKE